MFEELDVLSEGLEVSGAKESLMEVSKRFLIKPTRIFLTELFSVLIFKKTWIRAPDPDSAKRLDLACIQLIRRTAVQVVKSQKHILGTKEENQK